MHILDPARPRNASGLPMLLWEGKPACIVPTVMLNIQPDGRIAITMNTCINTSTARYYTAMRTQDAAYGWLEHWWTDPESQLLGLGWQWNASVPSIPIRSSVIASNLELDL